MGLVDSGGVILRDLKTCNDATHKAVCGPASNGCGLRSIPQRDSRASERNAIENKYERPGSQTVRI